MRVEGTDAAARRVVAFKVPRVAAEKMGVYPRAPSRCLALTLLFQLRCRFEVWPRAPRLSRALDLL